MSPGIDDGRGMSTTWLTDEAIEALVRDDEVDEALAPLAAFALRVRALGDEQAPPASAQLAALFEPRASTMPRTSSRRRGLGRLVKLAVGGSVAVAGLASAAAAGVLPDPARDGLRDAVDTLTPLDLPARPNREPTPVDDRGEPHGGVPDDAPTPSGDRVSDDATDGAADESDGQPGVDGREISEETPGSSRRPDDTRPDGDGDAGDEPKATGHDRAEQTPAAPHLPESSQRTEPDREPRSGPEPRSDRGPKPDDRPPRGSDG